MGTFRVRLLALAMVVAFVPLSAAAAPKDAKTADEIAALRKERAVLAEKCYRAAYEGLRQTRRFGNFLVQVAKPEEVYLWSVRWLKAQRDLSPKPKDQIAALEAHLKRMTELKERVEPLTRDLMPKSKVDEAEWYRVEAKLWLAQAKADVTKAR